MDRMTIGRFIIALGAALFLSFVAAGLYALHQFPDGQPMVGECIDVSSPNGSWIATLEVVDNGLGFGQGMLYDEVHLRRPNETLSSHGDRADSAVFYIDAMGGSHERPRLTWRDATHLVIGYDSKISESGRPGKRVTRFHGVSIEYLIDHP
jgi:hypothetical protein